MLFKQLNPGDRFVFNGVTFIKIDTVMDSERYEIATRGRWPYPNSYNAVNYNNGRMDMIPDDAEVSPA